MIKKETFEEIGVNVSALEEYAVVRYGDKIKVHAFLVDGWEGEPSESEEMRPQWFEKDKIPYEEMWDNDRVWLEKILEGEKLRI